MKSDTRVCERFEPDWELATLGALDDEQIQEMQRHIEGGCALCRERFLDAQLCTSAIGASLPEQQLSPQFESRLRTRIGAADLPGQTGLESPGPVRQPKLKNRIAPWLAAAAALVVATWLGFDRARLTSELEQARKTALPLPTPQPATPPVVVVPAPSSASGSENAELMQARIAELQRKVEELNAAAAKRQDPQPPSRQQTEQLLQNLAAANARARELELNLQDARNRIQILSAAARDLAQQPPQQPQQSSPAPGSDTRQLRQANATLTLELARKDAELQSQGRQVAELRSVLRVVQGGSLRQVELRPSDPSAQNSQGRVLISQSGVLVLARQLPKIPAGKCFQLWLIRKGDPSIVSGGLLEIDGQGSGILLNAGPGILNQVTGFAITDEPAGGSVKAQGHKLLFGAL
jgi:hypothetical protein